ncbi:MAG TPA: alpha/beta fold hydrolase [Polyangiaceae bacterium]|nr:alpha/beta fold hydrolase [Polyangiaceae bacterium]
MKRRPRPPRSESIEIHTESGVALRATVHDATGRARGTAILAHAEFSARGTFDGLARRFSARGWRTVAFDFRGHGESGGRKAGTGTGTGTGTGGDVTYDDLVQHDLPAVASSARARWSGPLIVVGHALGGHVALAACGTHKVDADGIALIASNVWIPQFEPVTLRWRAKQAAVEFISAVVRARGHFPARILGLGSDDESAALMRAAVRAAREGRWRSEDGSVDYERALGNVHIPVLAVASARDPIRCAPDCAERMLARCAGPRDFRVIARDDRDGPAPSHMGLLTGAHSSCVWDAVANWMESI